jgi:hypothetical protein
MNAALDAKAPYDRDNLRIATPHDRGAQMREDGAPDSGFFAPVQLGCDRSMTNQGAMLSQNH